jgi:hypothetical protein
MRRSNTHQFVRIIEVPSIVVSVILCEFGDWINCWVDSKTPIFFVHDTDESKNIDDWVSLSSANASWKLRRTRCSETWILAMNTLVRHSMILIYLFDWRRCHFPTGFQSYKGVPPQAVSGQPAYHETASTFNASSSLTYSMFSCNFSLTISSANGYCGELKMISIASSSVSLWEIGNRLSQNRYSNQ